MKKVTILATLMLLATGSAMAAPNTAAFQQNKGSVTSTQNITNVSDSALNPFIDFFPGIENAASGNTITQTDGNLLAFLRQKCISIEHGHTIT